MKGVRDAQVFLAIPPETPFLADQPKPTASVVIDADTVTAQAQGEAIANLVAGAVPGLTANDITVETTSGVTVFPPSGALAAGARLATQAQVEAEAIGRIAGLLTPLVGAGNFQANVSANLDFTQEHIHQIAYGPGHLVTNQKTSQSTQYGSPGAALGIPGALSNEPPSPTTASANAAPTSATAGGAGAAQGGNVVAAQTKPTQNSIDTDQSYVTDQSENDITKP
jgi:flagellar M-ring protein FliF